jgi:hypothetical protein
MLVWPLISIGIVRDLLASRINGEDQMPPQLLVDPSDVFERRGEASEIGAMNRAHCGCRWVQAAPALGSRLELNSPLFL